jgi:hypothetical protein
MPRKCTVCAHQSREEIDLALIKNGAFRDIAGRFGITRSSLERHKAHHIPATLSQAHEASTIAQADSLLNQLRHLHSKSLTILMKAEEVGDLRTALYAIGQARSNLDLLARLLGELSDSQKVNVLVASQDWLRLRFIILAALEPYPDARLSVVRALNESIGD